MNKNEFIYTANEIANIMDVKPNQIQIRKMKRKWGSCSPKGRVTFNLDLLDMDDNAIKEVIIHELLHLRYEKHDKLFKELLIIYMKKTKNVNKNKIERWI